MSDTYKTYHVKGERPAILSGASLSVPEHWLIFNAPRPLYASYIQYPVYAEWKGNFLHGVFYAAVDPEAVEIIGENIKLDGWVLQWHNEAEINAWVKKYYGETYPGTTIDYDNFDQRDFDHAFFNQWNKEL